MIRSETKTISNILNIFSLFFISIFFQIKNELKKVTKFLHILHKIFPTFITYYMVENIFLIKKISRTLIIMVENFLQVREISPMITFAISKIYK